MTRELIVFPDVEAWLVGYLAARLAQRSESYTAGVHVSNREPDPRPARSVIVRRNGGPRLDVVRELARMSIRVWGRTDGEATDLANLVRALVGICADGAPVCAVTSEIGPIAVPDPQPLRLLTVDLTVRGTAA